MSEDESAAPSLDLNAIAFPTDRLTLGQLRRLQPDLFQSRDGELLDLAAIPTLDLECALAEQAFAKVLKLADPHPTDDRQASLRILNQDYVRFGLSTGMQMTRRLVGDFERAASEQANVHRHGRAK